MTGQLLVMVLLATLYLLSLGRLRANYRLRGGDVLIVICVIILIVRSL
jgi:hypothetical protein